MSESPNPSRTAKLSEKLNRIFGEQTVGTIWINGAFSDASVLTLSDGHCGHEVQIIKRRLSSMANFEVLERIPILGVCGTMNSGKSTLVASFLSEEGAKRSLIGNLDSSKSTNRFTFWLPLSWKNENAISKNVEEFARSTFGASPEMLSEDPAEATAQQNARGSDSKQSELKIPLLAFDPGLDQYGIAFLDCPDVQRSADETTIKPTAQLRLDALEKGSRLCSAFVVVTTPEAAESEVMGRIFLALAATGRNLPIYFALNKLPRHGSLDESLGPIQEIFARWQQTSRVRRIFGARYLDSENGSPPRPQFKSLPGEVLPLASISQDLDASELFHKAIESAVSELTDSLVSLREKLEDLMQKQDSKTKKIHQSVSDFLSAELLDDEGGLRSFMPPGLASQVMKSFKRTAPFWMKPGFAMHKPVEIVLSGVANGLDWIRQQLPSNWLVSRLINKNVPNPNVLKQIDPGKFVSHMETSGLLSPDVKKESLSGIWTTGLEVIANQHLSEIVLDQKEIDALTAQVWKCIPLWKRAAIAVTLPLALSVTLLAVLFIPFDFGASAVMAASLSELFAAAGLGYLVNIPAMITLKALLQDKAGIPQISNLHGALCDGLGVPRQKKPKLKHRGTGLIVDLQQAKIGPQKTRVCCLDGAYFNLNAKAFDRIQDELNKLQQIEK